MKPRIINGKTYRMPNHINKFQLEMYVHLINWKWRHITEEPGYYKHKESLIPYDAILPDDYVNQEKMPHIHELALEHLRQHLIKNPFHIHPHFYHMVSSQAANINLFLPILHNPRVNDILGRLKEDFASLATDQLYGGYCLEYWGGDLEQGKGLLADKSDGAGTDADIAIAYRNHQGEQCLWMIEHKLTEAEFTTCGGHNSWGRMQHHDCTLSFSQILENKSACYYHDACRYKYWDITEDNREFFVNHAEHEGCPFKGGMSQLWRNQLLAMAIEHDERQLYKHVYFSVVKHPFNEHLDNTLHEYQGMIKYNPAFSVFTSRKVIDAAKQYADDNLEAWIKWYKNLYQV